MIALQAVSARGKAERGALRPTLTTVSLEHRRGVLGIVGATKDGTSLLFDLLDGSASPSSGRVVVLEGTPDAARSRVARVSLDAPLPEALRVDEVCALAADLRGEPRRAAHETLGVLGIAALGGRRVGSLAREERRAVALAIALGAKVDVLLLEEPLAWLDPVAPRLTIDALRARAASACVVVATASPRDATRLADELGVLTAGVYTPLPPALAYTSLGPEGGASIRIVVAPAQGKRGAAALAGVLGGDDAVLRVETSPFAAPPGAVAVVVTGRDLALLARAVTSAIASTRVDVELVEPSTLSLDAIRAALAARAASPPPGSLPPGPASIPPAGPASIPPAGPASIPPGSLPPAGPASIPPGSLPPAGPASVPPGSTPPASGGAR
ncbi:MAG: ATP-binding cassette domain-containing protein [Labilithrix sp.]|nr:ATP-binding cassette domain-containing protein [Labilithrix sp.]